MTLYQAHTMQKHFFRAFDNRQSLACALAEGVTQALENRLRQSERAALAVSGGKTPVTFFEALSLCKIEWNRIDVTLVDERWVDESSRRSNARLVKTHLLQNAASAANFMALYTGDATPEQALSKLSMPIGSLPLPFAAIVLGMGEDGHTASFFPYGSRLSKALDLLSPDYVEAMRAPNVEDPRMTLTLPILSTADWIALHIEGTKKRSILAEAEEGGPVHAMPIRAVLQAARHPLSVFWCP